MAGQGILTLMDRGGGNPVVLDHGSASLSWVLNGPGKFSCLVPEREARRYAIAAVNPLGRRWIEYRHPDLPTWGGVVTAVEWTPGQLEMIAEQYHVLLRKRRVNRVYGQQRATAGALARRAFNDVQMDEWTFIADFVADEVGEPMEYEWRGGDLMDDVLRGLVYASGQEWTVDANRIASWRARLGQDRSAEMTLRHPVEIADYRFSGDLWTTENDIIGVAADNRFADATNLQIDDTDSIKAHGRYQTLRRYVGTVSNGTLSPKLRRDLARLRYPTQTIEVTTANVGRCWSRYGLGDSVTVVLPGADVKVVGRIEARSVSIDQGIETLGVVV